MNYRKILYFHADCPGTQSEEAGKVSACAGCPNQSLCASGATRGQNGKFCLSHYQLNVILSADPIHFVKQMQKWSERSCPL